MRNWKALFFKITKFLKLFLPLVPPGGCRCARRNFLSHSIASGLQYRRQLRHNKTPRPLADSWSGPFSPGRGTVAFAGGFLGWGGGAWEGGLTLQTKRLRKPFRTGVNRLPRRATPARLEKGALRCSWGAGLLGPNLSRRRGHRAGPARSGLPPSRERVKVCLFGGHLVAMATSDADHTSGIGRWSGALAQGVSAPAEPRPSLPPPTHGEGKRLVHSGRALRCAAVRPRPVTLDP